MTKRTRHRWIGLAAALAAVALVPSTAAQPARKARAKAGELREKAKERREKLKERREAAKELRDERRELRKDRKDLTDEERKERREELKEKRDELREAHKELKEAHRELRDEVKARKAEIRNRWIERRKTRWQRRKEHRRKLRRAWGKAVVERPAVRAELRTHARRMARLKVMRLLAEDAEKTKLTERIDKLTSKEKNRHQRRMEELQKGAGGPAGADEEKE